MRQGKQVAMALKTANSLHGEKRLHALENYIQLKKKYSERKRLIPHEARV